MRDTLSKEKKRLLHVWHFINDFYIHIILVSLTF